jgi:hypothetical protein
VEKRIVELEELESLSLNRNELLKNLIECVMFDNQAEDEIQFYCFDLARAYGYIRDHDANLINAIYSAGQLLASIVRYHQLYHNGRLAYRFGKAGLFGIEMLREDLFFKELTNEFNGPIV